MNEENLKTISGEVSVLVEKARGLSEGLSSLLSKADDVMAALGKAGDSRFENMVASIRARNDGKPLSNAEMDAIVKCLGPVEVEVGDDESRVDAVARAIAGESEGPRKRLLFDELAVEATEYVRNRVWSSSLLNRIIPVERATSDMLSIDWSEDLKIWWEKEPDSPAAVCVPLNNASDLKYIGTGRYAIPIAGLMSAETSTDSASLLGGRKFTESLDNLADSARDKLDGAFLDTVDRIVFNADGPSSIGGDGIVNPNRVTGKAQWMDLPDTEDGFMEATKMLPCGNKDGKFVVRNFRVAMSAKTAERLNVGKVALKAFGTSRASYPNGVVLFKDGMPWEDPGPRFGRVYFFAEPLFLGKFFKLEDFTVYNKAEAFFLRSFLYFMGGFAIGNTGAVAVARFQTEGKE